MRHYKALDTFCKAGGATKGLQRAGFWVCGVDIEDQKHYCGDMFVQGDALEFIRKYGREFDFIWASPPCQAYSSLRGLGKQAHRPKRRLIAPTRRELISQKRPFCIENVPGAPLRNPVTLCGHFFGLGVRRHRNFECSFPVLPIECRKSHKPNPVAVYGDHPERHTYRPGSGGYINRAHTLRMEQRAMGIDWMDWREITQAIPPAYSEFIGKHAIQWLEWENIARLESRAGA